MQFEKNNIWLDTVKLLPFQFLFISCDFGGKCLSFYSLYSRNLIPKNKKQYIPQQKAMKRHLPWENAISGNKDSKI